MLKKVKQSQQQKILLVKQNNPNNFSMYERSIRLCMNTTHASMADLKDFIAQNLGLIHFYVLEQLMVRKVAVISFASYH